ncbi:MAG TPA: preprotein translocase subunit YajC [Candidatus Thiothrix moscowensis]|uniref:preprotein translocase subunit YajC n=1 Tax=unclassified Thiothrix TaxID=2636184 RepID=UPI001A359AAB|nr:MULTISPECIES: preprotein translocase subunit YajC [unclassified Thiothrix]MBJ6612168.1 preprotein translocase subunit YajC [Candidatus Thiothrix moscowensis]HRJ53895.1 preprotein translocase subunit YajC [Candidatus Thiothrix moscowensis]HRJ93977.1 preprotein translocase subunit YajC [Candidatus Thiothrix moscowensis]
MDFLISNAYAEGAAAPAGGGLEMILMMAVFFAIMYFMIIRPQQKRAKEHKQMLDALNKGDEVVTGGGILGKVASITDNFIELTIADNVTVKVQKQAVATVMPKGTMKSA